MVGLTGSLVAGRLWAFRSSFSNGQSISVFATTAGRNCVG